MNRFSPLLGFLSASALVLAACNGLPGREMPDQPLSRRLTWDGQSPLSHSIDSGQGLAAEDSLSGIVRIHSLDLPSADSLRLVLREYKKDFLAFRAFQEKAGPAEIQDGFFRQKNSLIFFHGPYLGELRYGRSGLIPASFLKERMSFQDEELFRRPEVFGSFPLGGQIPFSERVVSSEFLGQWGVDTVFIMRYQCHEDTATLFRAFAPFPVSPESWLRTWKGQKDTLGWTREMHFSGVQDLNRPLLFWLFKGGFLGVAGCYDQNLAQEYAEKLKKMALITHKP